MQAIREYSVVKNGQIVLNLREYSFRRHNLHFHNFL